MKSFAFIITFIVFVSCNNEVVEKTNKGVADSTIKKDSTKADSSHNDEMAEEIIETSFDKLNR